MAALAAVILLAAPAIGATDDQRWVIENHSRQNAPVAFAAGELGRYLDETAGHQTHRGATKPGAARIVLGLRADLPTQERALLPKPEEGFDGYAVAITTSAEGTPLWIIGGDNARGVVYGAYDVLERLGWRWFHPQLDPNDGEVRPASEKPMIPEGQWAVASPMRTRALIWYVSRKAARTAPPTPDALRKQIDWAVKNRYNTLEHRALELDANHPLRRTLREETARRGMRIQSPGHNFDIFFPDSTETFIEHPEWFGERNGRRHRHTSEYGAQFCWTHEGAIQVFLENVVNFVGARPELDVLTLSALDGGTPKPCACETCSERSPTDRYLDLVNRVVAALKETAPHVTVEAIVGYQHVEDPPKLVKPDDALRGRFAAWRRGVAKGYDTDRTGPKVRLWSDVFDRRLTAFQYYSDHLARPPLAVPYTTQIRGDRALLLNDGADGMLNLLFLDGYWWRQTLNAYLAGRSFYDKSTDPDQLLADYANRYHGPKAGPAMAEYYRDLAADPRIAYRAWRTGEAADRELFRHVRQRQLVPAADAVADDPILRHRMNKAMKWHELAERTMATGMSLRKARKLAAAGRPGLDAALATARARYGAVQEFAANIVKLDQGIVDASFTNAYRAYFNTLAAKIERLAAREAAKKTSPSSTPAPPE